MVVTVENSDGFEVAPAPYENKPEQNAKVEQGKEDKVSSIKFGSHDEASKGEENINVSISDVPKDAIEEWPAEKKSYAFYFVKHRHYDDPKLKTKLDQAENERLKLNQNRARLVEQLRTKKAKRSELYDLREPLMSERKGYNSKFDEKRKEMEPLQQALGKLKGNEGGSRGPGICSSEKELNNMIYSYEYRIQHESISLNEEKQLLKEIKQLEGTRDKVIANEALRAKINESLGHKDDIQDQVKSMGAGLDGVKKERQAISARINELSEQIKVTKDEIQVLEDELNVVTEKRDKVSSNIQELRKQHQEMNGSFYQSRAVLNKARDLAAQKNVKELETLCNAEGEKFISLWCSNKEFKEDYEKRLLPSLDARQLSRDGRIRNPEEKPLLAPESSKTEAKQPKEEPVSAPKPDASAPKKAKKDKDAEKAKDEDDDDEVYGLGKPQKDEIIVIDEAAIKEKRRKEEIMKAKQAMERKKKQAEKSAAKAAIKAQKEAEKKKEREKKGKKKGGNTVEPEAEEVLEASEAVNEEEVEDEEVEKREEVKMVKRKKQGKKMIQKRAVEIIGPRPTLKRKKSSNYWVWAAPAGLGVLMLLVLGYYYYNAL